MPPRTPSAPAEQPKGPLQVVMIAVKAVKEVRWALGGAGVLAAAALGIGFFSSARAAIIGAAVMLCLMVLLFLFAAMTRLGPVALRVPATFFVWFVLLLFCTCAGLTVTSVFLEWPDTFPRL